jgi:alkanesulfonate monooxygenase SsuD/methylene tetrahydromethanopterin reductase-like flavin-dependent oxidoreductase (luciferase family)
VRYRELNGCEAPKPILCVFVGVSHDPSEARRMRESYLQRYARSTVEHYQFANVAFERIEGYEYYGALARNIAKHGVDRFNGFLADLQVWGNPRECVDKLRDYVRRCDAGGLLVTPVFGGMPFDVADANYDLLAREVLPALKDIDVGGDVGVLHAPHSTAA